MIVNTPLQIVMEILSSSMSGALYTIGSIAAIALLLAIFWFAGGYLGRPLGTICIRTFPDFINGMGNSKPPPTATELVARRTRAANCIGAMSTLYLCIMTWTFDAMRLAEQHKLVPETRSMWVVVPVVVTKGTLQSLLVVGMLSGIVRAFGFGKAD
jgi:hypothetical protein